MIPYFFKVCYNNFRNFSREVLFIRVLTYITTAEDTGRPVKHLLREKIQLSYTRMQSLKWKKGAILLNGGPCTLGTAVQAGDVLAVDVSDTHAPSRHIAPMAGDLAILWEDEDLLILSKAAGMTVHDSALTQESVTVAGLVAHYLGTTAFHPVNRLDRGVTGIMVVAKSGHVHDLCMRLLHTDGFRREYRGICLGTPSSLTGTIDLPIAREGGSAIKRCIDPAGSPSATEYEVLQPGQFSLLRLRPLTGRTHQLRLHCAAIGHPLVGDFLYGEENERIARPALHSYELWLSHPITGEKLHLIDELPADMQNLLQ